MGNQLNIKSDEAYALASELAALTGESLTAAVTTSLRERLDREKRERDKEARVQRILAMTREIKAHIEPGTRSEDHADLYGDDGLPA